MLRRNTLTILWICSTLGMAYPSSALAQSSFERQKRAINESSLPQSEKSNLLRLKAFEQKRQILTDRLKGGDNSALVELGHLFSTTDRFYDPEVALAYFSKAADAGIAIPDKKIKSLKEQLHKR